MIFRVMAAYFVVLAACEQAGAKQGQSAPSPASAEAPSVAQVDSASTSTEKDVQEERGARVAVHWDAELGLDALGDLEEARAKEERDPIVELAILDDRKKPMSCVEWQRWRQEGYAPTNTVESQNDGYALYRCGTLAWLQQAQPAGKSYVDVVTWGPGLLDLLPPTLASAMDDEVADAADKAAAAGQRWSQFDPRAKAKKADAVVGIDVTEARSNGLTRLRPTAWGDFNGDSIGDVVVFVVNADRLGSYADFRLVLLTRHSEGGPLDLVDTWKP